MSKKENTSNRTHEKSSVKSAYSADILYVVKIALPLVIICALIALLVATVNYFTAPVIERNNEKALREAIEELFPMPDIVYEECDFTLGDDSAAIDTIYAVTSGGSPVGYCVKLSPNGFKGEVDMVVSLDTSAFVTGVKITSTNDETSGIGTKVAEKSFTDRFIESDGNTLSNDVKDYIISGATKTSKPVTEAIFAAKRAVQYRLNANSAADDGTEFSDSSDSSNMLDLHESYDFSDLSDVSELSEYSEKSEQNGENDPEKEAQEHE